MNTKEIITDEFERFVQIIKMFTNPTDQFLSELAANPNIAVDAIDDLYIKIKDVVTDIKYDLDNRSKINLSDLIKIRDAKVELVAIRKKLTEKINEETQAAKDLIIQIEQI